MPSLFQYAMCFGLPLQPIGQDAIGRAQPRRWLLILGYGILASTAVVFANKVVDPGDLWDDFTVAYHPAGRLIFTQPRDMYPAEGRLGFVNIPIIAVLFVPFSSLSLASAQMWFLAVGVLLLAITCWLLIRHLGATGWTRLSIIGLFVLNGPLYYSIREGNLTHYVFCLLVAAFLCLENKRDYWGGAILALAALVKIPLLLFGVYYLVRGRWRVLAGFCSTLVAVVGASLALFGPDLHLFWHSRCIAPFSGKPLTAYNVQSLSSFLGRLLTDNGVGSWDRVEVGRTFQAAHLLLLGLVGGAAAWVLWFSRPSTRPEAQRLEFAIVLCLALVTSPISWTHYYLFLILPFALYLGNRLAVPKGRLWLGAGALALSLVTPPGALYCNPTAWSRLMASHYLYGGLLLLGTLLLARKLLPSQAEGAGNAAE